MYFLLQNFQIFSTAPNFFKIYVSNEEYIFTLNSLEMPYYLLSSPQISKSEQQNGRTSAMEGFCIQSSWLSQIWVCTGVLVCPWIPSSSLQSAFAEAFDWKNSQERAFPGTRNQWRGTFLVLWQSAGKSCILDETRIFLKASNVLLHIFFLAFHRKMLVLIPTGSNDAPREAWTFLSLYMVTISDWTTSDWIVDT